MVEGDGTGEDGKGEKGVATFWYPKYIAVGHKNTRKKYHRFFSDNSLPPMPMTCEKRDQYMDRQDSICTYCCHK